MIILNLGNKTKSKVSEKIFSDLLEPAFAALVKDKKVHKKEEYWIELTLVGNALIKKLNHTYHHKDRPTDVISLSYFEKNMSDPLVGEIFISVPFAKQQAAKIGQSLKQELRFLFIHGLLHSFGYDHKKPKEEKHMLALTYSILGRE